MPVSLIKNSFAGGELSPSFWGRTDEARFAVGASVIRNCFVNFRGGTSSRAGTAFVGKCRQGGNDVPPRVITFRFSIFQDFILEFGDRYMRIAFDGAYVTETPVAVSGMTNANPALLSTLLPHGFSDGDEVFVSGVQGMTQVDSRFFLVSASTPTAFQILDSFGDTVDARAYGVYAGGGQVARVYTVPSPYAGVDLDWIKYTQSADVMSLCLVNQETGTEYVPFDLLRRGVTDWAFVETSRTTSIGPPATVSAVASVTTVTTPSQYAYCVTVVDDATGQESIASPVAYVTNSVDIALTLGAITITWSPVVGAAYYNVYKAPPAVGGAVVPIGVSFGYLGSSSGNQFVDSNIIQDATTTPPLHLDPFARGQVLRVVMGTAGSGFTQTTATATVVSATGSGAVVVPVIVSGTVAACIVTNSGRDYRSGDTVVFGGGNGASASVVVGPLSGTFPGVVAYFQQRRVYAATLNNPDTLFFSRTGAFLNMDSSTPPIDSDAIVATPWAQQVNTVQWLLPMPGGLVTFNGLDAWQVAGTSGPGSVVTPAQIQAQPQESNGTSATVLPIKINQDIIYLQSLQTTIRDFEYNFFTNIYTGQDISFYSGHLFENYQVVQWAWAQEPYKLIWAVRNDGKLLSMTYVKEQKVAGWARHDTRGLFKSVTTASEPPVNAAYFVVYRYIAGKRQWAYYLERMDNRQWQGAEDPWCVDCGLSLPQPTPDATLAASSAIGDGRLVDPLVASGGSNYSLNPAVRVFDPQNPAAVGNAVATVVDGVITGFTVSGVGFTTVRITVADATGSGAALSCGIDNSVMLIASRNVFSPGDIGSVVRVCGGAAQVTAFVSPNQVAAEVLRPLVLTIPDDPSVVQTPVPAPPGSWTITAPITTLTNLDHLEGMQVSALADGNAVTGLVVSNGTVTLPTAASDIKVGLPFVAQVQGMHADIPGGQTIQAKTKRVSGVTVRQEKSRGIKIGANQPVASTFEYQQEVPWQKFSRLSELNDRTTTMIYGQPIPLVTGDNRVPIEDLWQSGIDRQSYGMVAAQQDQPLPMNILSFVYSIEIGSE